MQFDLKINPHFKKYVQSHADTKGYIAWKMFRNGAFAFQIRVHPSTLVLT
jgi:hypothetical protein